MTSDRWDDFFQISCDTCDEAVLEKNFHDAKDVIDSLGWKTILVDDDWEHKCASCIQDERDDINTTLMERFEP